MPPHDNGTLLCHYMILYYFILHAILNVPLISFLNSFYFNKSVISFLLSYYVKKLKFQCLSLIRVLETRLAGYVQKKFVIFINGEEN